MYESIIKAVKKIRKNTGKKRNNLFINFVNTVGTKEKFCNCTKCKAMNILVCNDIKYILSEIIYLGLSNILLFLYFLKILKFQNINIFEVYINKFYYNDQLLELLDLEIITLEPKHEQLVLNIGIYFSSIIFINDRTVEMVIPKLIYINLVKKIEGNLTHNIFYIPMQKIIDYISINTIMYDNLYYSIMNFNKICTIYENLKLPNIDNAHYRYYKGKIILYINNPITTFIITSKFIFSLSFSFNSFIYFFCCSRFALLASIPDILNLFPISILYSYQILLYTHTFI
jgi:hypothetical protein